MPCLPPLTCITMARAAYGRRKVLFTDLHGPLQVYAVYIRLNMGGLYKVLTLPRSPRRQVITGDSHGYL